MNTGGYIYGMNDGNIVPGPNVNSDVVPAMLTPGEFVVNREATRANLPLLQAINGSTREAGRANILGGFMSARAANTVLRAFGVVSTSGKSARLLGNWGMLLPNTLNRRLFHKIATGAQLKQHVSNPRNLIDVERFLAFKKVSKKDIDRVQRQISSGMSSRLVPDKKYSDAEFGALAFSEITPAIRALESRYPGISLAYQKDRMQPGRRDTVSSSSRHGPSPTAINVPGGRGSSYGSGSKGKVWAHFSDAEFNENIAQLGEELSQGHGAEMIAGIKSAQQARYRRENRDLLEAMGMNIGGMIPGYNRGGRVPGYNRGGMVPGVQYFNEGSSGPVSAFTSGLRNPYGKGLASGGLRMPTGMLGQTAISMGGFYAGQAVGGAAGTGIMIASGLLPLMSGLRGLGGILPMVTKLAGVLGRLTIPGAVIGSAFALGKFLLDAKRNAEETAKANRQAFGMSADVIKKAGYSITDYNANIKDALESLKALRERNRMLYESMFQAGIPIKMTIAEYKKLRAEVKEGMPDLIKTFNVAPNASTASVATSLKAQFMSLGDDIDTATAKVYALMSQSNKAQFAAAAIGSKGFAAIKTSIDAAIASAGNFDRALSEGETKAAADALIVTFEGIGNAIEDNAKKNKISFGQSMDEVLKKMSESGKGQIAINKDALNELKKQNPELARIINSTDTATSAWAKYQLALKNVNIDLQTLSAQAAQSALKLNDLATTQTIASLKSTPGISKQYAAYDKMLARIKDLTKATKGQSAAAEISTRKQIEALNKQINAIKKAADEKIKALRCQAQAEDDNLEIQKLQLEYQQALSRGDKDAAASAQIALQQFTNQVQTRKAEEAIQAKADLQIKPLQDKIDALGKKNQDLADKAALAGDSLSKLQGEAEKLKSKLDAVETAGIAALFEALLNKDNPKYQGSKQQLETLSALDKAVVEAGGVSSLKTINTQTHPKQRTNLFRTEFTDKSGGSKNIIDQAVQQMSVQAQVVNLIGEIKSGTFTGTGSKDSPKIISKDYSSSVTRGGMGGRLRAEQLIKENKLRAGQYIKYNDIDYEVLTDNILKPVGQRAAGGPVSAGSLYRVNETNMEFFRPNISGSILPSGTYPLGASYNIPSSAPSSVGNAGANNSFNNNVYNIDIDLNGTNVTADDIMRRFKSELALIGAREGRSRVVGGSY